MDRRAKVRGVLAAAMAALALAALVTLTLLPAGCSTCRLPRIDPSGEHVFVPGSTTAVTAAPVSTGGGCLFGWGPKPAFVSPADPPPCDFAYTEPADPCNAILGAPVPCPMDCPPVAGPVIVQPASVTPGLVISPGSLISPVGTEVILTAGLAEKHGGLCRGGERIEWMLSQDSVGTFVEIGEPGDHFLWNYVHHRTPKKLSSNYAIGFGSRNGERITRGTPNPADDATVPVGHSWLTLTSATEGASHVTAYAPDAQGFERRQQTATVYWIDAQWAFPPPLIGRAGEKQILTTNVTRSTNGSPLAGWIVRYEAVGGPGVGFGTGGERVIEAQTNPNGQASVEVFPTSREAGVTQIAISVIRPAGADGLPRTTVGQGATTVTWSAPSLAVRLSGPEIAEVGSTVSYRIEVANPGDLPAREVRVEYTLHAAFQYVSSSPAAQVLGERVVWSLGDLAPKAIQVIELNCRAAGRGDVKTCALARTGDGLTAENCFTTRVFVRSLAVNLTGPQTAQVGETVNCGIEVRNQGDEIVRNVVLRDRYDAGLRHEQPNPLTWPIGDIAPGQTIQKALTFQVVAPGQVCHNLEVSGDGEQTVTARQCLTATQQAVRPAAPRLTIRHTAPAAARQGETILLTIEVANTGDAALSNVRVANALSPNLVPQRATDGHAVPQNNVFQWIIPQLAPGDKQERVVECLCGQPNPQACSRAVVSSDQTAAQEQVACVRIDAGAGGGNPGVGMNPGGAEPGVGTLDLNLVQFGEPVNPGVENTYRLTITNGRNVADRNVSLVIYMQGFTNIRTPPNLARAQTADQLGLVLGPIAELRPGEKIQIDIKAIAPRQPGSYTIQAQAGSQLQPQGAAKQVKTTVNPPN